MGKYVGTSYEDENDEFIIDTAKYFCLGWENMLVKMKYLYKSGIYIYIYIYTIGDIIDTLCEGGGLSAKRADISHVY